MLTCTRPYASAAAGAGLLRLQPFNAMFVNLRDSRESPDVLTVFGDQLLHVCQSVAHQFQIHRYRFNSFVYRHS
jgi:hypothetical protein